MNVNLKNKIDELVAGIMADQEVTQDNAEAILADILEPLTDDIYDAAFSYKVEEAPKQINCPDCRADLAEGNFCEMCKGKKSE